MTKALGRILRRDPWYWLRKIHFVTGADSSHFQSSLNLLESIRTSERFATVTFWDFGLLENEIRTLRTSFPRVNLKRFDFSKYPEFMNIRKNAGNYAWKPVAIHQTAQELSECGDENRLLVWADAGNLILQRLTRLRGLVGLFGVYTPKSPGKLKTWTHPQTLKILQIEERLQTSPNCNAALVAIDLTSHHARELLDDWRLYAFREECIAPKGHSLLNHRYDQAILSCLVVKRNLIPSSSLLAVEELGVKIHQDVEVPRLLTH